MAGTPGHSGRRPESIETHLLRGTFRPHRHAKPNAPPPVALTEIERRKTLRGLPPLAREIAGDLLRQFGGWDRSSLESLRAYSLSVARLRALQAMPDADPRVVHREVRHNALLLKMLNLEAVR